jgi:hypothetical protein
MFEMAKLSVERQLLKLKAYINQEFPKEISDPIIKKMEEISKINIVTISYLKEVSIDGVNISDTFIQKESTMEIDDLESFYVKEYDIYKLIELKIFHQCIGGYKTDWMKLKEDPKKANIANNTDPQWYRFSIISK